MADTSFLTKYRPQTFDDVLGQDKTVRSLQAALKKGAGHAYLFTGPSGTGKTTLARLVATALGAEPLQEIDAATNSGVEEMRAVTASFTYMPLNASGVKAVLVDECHMLSKNAWNSVLKTVEDPPPWGYWLFCTTEPAKVPDTVKSRCLSYAIKRLGVADLIALLEGVVEQEKLDTPEEVVDLCADAAGGSARLALSHLAVCQAAKDRSEAAELLRQADESTQAIDLARALSTGNWNQATVVLKKLTEVSPETVRHIVNAYFAKVALSAPEPKAGRAIEIMDAFSQPFNSSDGIAPLVLACGKALLS